jgi:hypothetical protein
MTTVTGLIIPLSKELLTSIKKQKTGKGSIRGARQTTLKTKMKTGWGKDHHGIMERGGDRGEEEEKLDRGPVSIPRMDGF